MHTTQNVQSLGSLIKAVDTVMLELDAFRSKVNTLKSELVKAQNIMTPEEEFNEKFPDIQVEPEYFRLVGCMSDFSEEITDKDLIIDAIKAKY